MDDFVKSTYMIALSDDWFSHMNKNKRQKRRRKFLKIMANNLDISLDNQNHPFNFELRRYHFGKWWNGIKYRAVYYMSRIKRMFR